MTIDASTGLVTWIPAADQLGDQSVAIAADDNRGGIATQSLTVAVRSQPTISRRDSRRCRRLRRRSMRCSLTTHLVLDPDNDPVQFLLDNAPAGMSIDPDDGTVRWQRRSISEATCP